MVEPRTADLEYAVEHHVDAEHGDRFFVLTNADGAEDFKVMVTPVASPGRASWAEVIPHRPGVRVADVEAFAEHLLVSEREGGLEQLRVRRIADDDEHLIEVPDPVYSVWAGENADYETDRRAVRVHVLGPADLGVRLRPADPRVDAGEAGAGPRWLRREPLHLGPALGDGV